MYGPLFDFLAKLLYYQGWFAAPWLSPSHSHLAEGRRIVRRYPKSIRFGIMSLSLTIAALGVSACGTATDAADKVNDAASQASDAADKVEQGANDAQEGLAWLNVSPQSVRDKLTAKHQTSTLTLDSDTCSQQGPAVHVKSISDNWPTGPYMTLAEQSLTKDGDYKLVSDANYGAVNPDPQADPRLTWQWNCGIPKDHLGYLRVAIVHFTKDGTIDKATRWSYLKVTP